MKKIKVIDMNNFAYKAIGLYQKNENNPIFFQTRFGVQTFFLKHDTLVLVLEPIDPSKRIFKVISSKLVKPNKIFFWDLKYKDIVEIPVAKKNPTEITSGEKVKLIS